MLLNVLKSKIHRAVVTHADVNYEGSISLDLNLMEAAGLYENELVHVWNATNGNRITTYVMTPAERGSGTVCINGAAAHKVHVGDIVIIATFAHVDEKDIKNHRPNKVIVGPNNAVRVVKHV